MKASRIVLLAVLGIGGYLLYKNRGQLLAAFGADPTVNGVARAQYGTSQDVPGTIAGATGIRPASPGSQIGAALSIVRDVLGGQGSSGGGSTVSTGLAGNTAPQLVTGQSDGILGGDAFGAMLA